MAIYELDEKLIQVDEGVFEGRLKLVEGAHTTSGMRVELSSLDLTHRNDWGDETYNEAIVARGGVKEVVPKYFSVTVLGTPREEHWYGLLEGEWDGVNVKAIPFLGEEEKVVGASDDTIWWSLRVDVGDKETKPLVVPEVRARQVITARFNIQID